MSSESGFYSKHVERLRLSEKWSQGLNPKRGRGSSAWQIKNSATQVTAPGYTDKLIGCMDE